MSRNRLEYVLREELRKYLHGENDVMTSLQHLLETSRRPTEKPGTAIAARPGQPAPAESRHTTVAPLRARLVTPSSTQTPRERVELPFGLPINGRLVLHSEFASADTIRVFTDLIGKAGEASEHSSAALLEEDCGSK